MRDIQLDQCDRRGHDVKFGGRRVATTAPTPPARSAQHAVLLGPCERGVLTSNSAGAPTPAPAVSLAERQLLTDDRGRVQDTDRHAELRDAGVKSILQPPTPSIQGGRGRQSDEGEQVISDREAAKRRAEKVVSEISGRVNVALHGSKIEPGLSLHNMFRPAVSEMQQKLVETYAQLDGADQAPLHDDLITTISDRVIAFIRSTVAGIRGSAVQNAARLAADLEASVRMSVPTEFDLAVYDAHKEKAALAPPVPTRRKQDKFGILDARTHHYDADYRLGIGMLGVAVIYFDLDHFKAINTKFTEPVVDRELLIQLNQLVADLVEGRGFGYAEGGDEFLILLKNTSLKIAEVFVQELLEALREKTFVVQGEEVKVTASAGIAWSKAPDGAQACLDAAALAKKAAKEGGRDRYTVASP